LVVVTLVISIPHWVYGMLTW